MRGVVFTEFMEMVESRMGLDMLDRIITDAQLPNDGAYTSVGTYEPAELVRLVAGLAKETGLSGSQQMSAFGEHLFERFCIGYPAQFGDADNAFDFICRIEGVIEVEVRKLYRDVEPPRVHCERRSEHALTVLYGSPRGFGDLVAGLVAGCVRHFDEPITVTRTDLEKRDNCHRVRFDLVRG